MRYLLHFNATVHRHKQTISIIKTHLDGDHTASSCDKLNNGKKQLFTVQADELAALYPRRFAKAMYENLATR